MPSNAFPEEAVTPQETAEQLLHWLLGTSAHVVLGLVLGAIAARSMRRMHLHWSWAACVLALVVVARSEFAGSASTLAVAAAFASLRGRRWHREDMDAGVDLAEVAARRLRPLELLLALTRTAATRAQGRLSATRGRLGDELRLGVDESGRPVSIPFGGRAGAAHTLVVGATGSGKTVTQTSIALQAIARGMAAIVVDPKGDAGMRERVRHAALTAGRRFYEWSPGGDCIYNPYARGGASEIADKALAGERFTEPHYLRQAQRYLGHAVRALRCAGSEVSLQALVEHLDPAQLEVLARSLPEDDARATFAYLDSLSTRQHAELAGVRDRLAILAESDVGPWLDPRTDGAARLNLLDVARTRAVAYFNLESDSRPLLSEMLGAAIVQDLQTVVASLQGAPAPTLLVLDEFSALAADQVVRLFGRARSAGVSLLLGTQELSDLRLPGRERLLEQVLGNLSVLIAHRQVVPNSAELIAGLAGAKGTWRTSHHSEGRTTRVRTREAVLDPDRVTRLARGWAAVLVLGDGGHVHIARMFSPSSSR